MTLRLGSRLDAISAVLASLVSLVDAVPPPAAASRCGLVCGGDQWLRGRGLHWRRGHWHGLRGRGLHWLRGRRLLLLHETVSGLFSIWAPHGARLSSMTLRLGSRLDAISAVLASPVSLVDAVPPPAAARLRNRARRWARCRPVCAPLGARLPSMAICLRGRRDTIAAIVACLVIGCNIIPPPTAASRCGLVCGGIHWLRGRGLHWRRGHWRGLRGRGLHWLRGRGLHWRRGHWRGLRLLLLHET